MLKKETIQQVISDNKLESNSFLLTVSGGVDSMVLLDVFRNLKFPFSVAHCNFQLREEAELETKLVIDYCAKYSIPLFSKHFNTNAYATENKLSTQLAARELRFSFFETLLKENNLDIIVTAHHANDRVEGVLMALGKGMGIDGLSGLHYFEKNKFKPMLAFSKTEIEAYAIQNAVPFLTDKSNKDTKYLRNYIRNEVVPILEKKTPKFVQQANMSIQYLQEAEKFIADQLNQFIDLNVQPEKNYKSIKNAGEHVFLVKQYLLRYGFSREELNKVFISLHKKNTGKVFNSKKNFQVLINREDLLLRKKPECKEQEITIILTKEELISTFNAEVNYKSRKIDFTEEHLYLSLNKITYPLKISGLTLGDKILPVNKRKEKLISDVLVDRKINLFDKEDIKVLKNNNNEVLMIFPILVSDLVKVDSVSDSVLVINK